MTQTPQPQVSARPRPQPDIYTLLLIVAILALGATIGVVIWNLTTGYGIEFADIVQGKLPT